MREAPKGKPYRVSSESVWPLRNVEGLTYAQAKAKEASHVNPS